MIDFLHLFALMIGTIILVTLGVGATYILLGVIIEHYTGDLFQLRNRVRELEQLKNRRKKND